jgi:hypothetical protein
LEDLKLVLEAGGRNPIAIGSNRSEKLFIVTDTGLPARHLQHAENIGIVDNARKEGQYWQATISWISH